MMAEEDNCIKQCDDIVIHDFQDAQKSRKFQDVLKSFAKEIAEIIEEGVKKVEDTNNDLKITFDKEIVLGTIKQIIIFDFRNKSSLYPSEKFISQPSLHPVLLPTTELNLNLDSIITTFDAGNIAGNPDVISAIYEELLISLEPEVLEPIIISEVDGNEEKVFPRIDYAKAVSKNKIEVGFDSNVRASTECLRESTFDSDLTKVDFCCQILFIEKPLLKGK